MYRFLSHPHPFELVQTPDGVVAPRYTFRFAHISRGRICESTVGADTLEDIGKRYERVLEEFKD